MIKRYDDTAGLMEGGGLEWKQKSGPINDGYGYQETNVVSAELGV